MKKTILITGCAGFIGFNLSKKLTKKYNVIGIDNLKENNYSKLSSDRIKELKKIKNFSFKKIDISNYKNLEKFFKKKNFKIVIHLAATPGVRNSFKNPGIYFKNNIAAFYNIYLLSIKHKAEIFLFGSSSSVYGNNKNGSSDNPISFYAATKKCNEIISHSYVNSSKVKIVGLRFFTVYGPWGRPDMAIYKFSNKIFNKKKIELFNYGKHSRDFSYIDDVVKTIILIIKNKKKLKQYQIVDIGKGKTDKLKKLISVLKKNINKKIKFKKIAKQEGDVETTKANVKMLKKILNYSPNTNLETGIKKFINWYKNYHKI